MPAAAIAVYEERRDDAMRLIYEEAEGVRDLTPPRHRSARHGELTEVAWSPTTPVIVSGMDLPTMRLQ